MSFGRRSRRCSAVAPTRRAGLIPTSASCSRWCWRCRRPFPSRRATEEHRRPRPTAETGPPTRSGHCGPDSRQRLSDRRSTLPEFISMSATVTSPRRLVPARGTKRESCSWSARRSIGSAATSQLATTTTSRSSCFIADRIRSCCQGASRSGSSARVSGWRFGSTERLWTLKLARTIYGHLLAGRLLNAGLDLSQVSQILGHASVAVTHVVYARHDTKKLRAAFDRVTGEVSA